MAAQAPTIKIPGHVGSTERYAIWADPARWSSFLAHPLEGQLSRVRQAVEGFKKEYVNTTQYHGSISKGISCLRHLTGILPAVAILAGRPGLFDLFIDKCFKPAIGFSDGFESYHGPSFWFCGGFLKYLAKQNYVGIAAFVALEPSNWVTTAFFLEKYELIGSVANSLGEARRDRLDQLSLYGYGTFFTLLGIQDGLNAHKYSRKAEFYRTLPVDKWEAMFNALPKNKQAKVASNPSMMDAKISNNEKKADASKKGALQCCAKVMSLIALYIVGVKAPYRVALIETVPFVATYIKYR